jgi:HEAT repeat protein
VREAVEARLGDEEPDLREEALDVLAGLRPPAPLLLLAERLRDPETQVRRAAVQALSALHGRRAEAVLLPLLQDPVPAVRLVTTYALAFCESPAAVGPLLRILREDDSDSLRMAFESVARFEAREAGPLILRRLREGDPETREAARQALLRSAGPELLPDLRRIAADPKDEARTAVIPALARSGGAEAVPDLLRLLADADPAVRREALDALPDDAARRSADLLVKLLSDPFPSVRGAAAGRLLDLGRPEDRPRVHALLEDPDDGVVEHVLELVHRRGHRDALPRLWALADGKRDEPESSRVLGAIGEFADPLHAPEFLKRLDRAETAPPALLALGSLGPPPEIVALALRGLDGKDDELRADLYHALVSFDTTEPVLAAVRKGLASRTATDRAAAAQVALSLAAWPLIPELLPLAEDPVPEVRETARNTLQGLGTERLLPLVTKWATSDPPNPGGEDFALETLVLLRAREAVPALRRRLERSAAPPPFSLMTTLASLGDASVLPGLREVVRRVRPGWRGPLLDALGEIGGAGVLPDLLEALDDPTHHVRRSAARALSRLSSPDAVPRLLERAPDLDEILPHLERGFLPRHAGALLGRLDEAGGEPSLDRRVVRARALLAVDPERGRGALRELLEDPDGAVRQAALQAVAEDRDPPLVGRVAKAIDDPAPDVFALAVVLAGDLRLREAVPALLRHLETDSRDVIENVLLSLQRIGDPAAVPALRKLLTGSPWNPCRRAAAEALASLGVADGVPLLLRGRARCFELNGARRPELWRRLSGLDLAFGEEGRAEADFRRLAEAAGLKPEPGPGAARIDRRRSRDGVGRLSWLRHLDELCGEDFVPVLEEGTLRILSREEGRAFWTAWRDAGMPRKP